MRKRGHFSSALGTFLPETLLFLCCLCCLGLVLYAPLALAEPAAPDGLTPEEAALWEAYGSGQLIRLHILADSDRPEDQRVKLAVRDVLLAAFGQELTKAGEISCEQVYTLLQDNVSAMETAALDCARRQGFTGSVTARTGLLALPEKQYGRITLPAGEYRGLQICLGSGQGHNWWCILFPRLCLALADDEPWQTPPADGPGEPDAGALIWDTEKIFRCWLAVPEPSPPEAADGEAAPM